MLKFIKRYEACWILSFPSIKNWKIEIVYAPRKYQISPHTHEHQHIKLILLFGHNICFYRTKKGTTNQETFNARFRDVGTMFTIGAGDNHHFTVSNWPLVFLNIEKYVDGYAPTSAAEDLQLT
jgi:hypothetical protein